MLTDDKIEEIINFLQSKLSAYYIVLFGSTVRNRERTDSDIDIGFLSDQETDPYTIFLIAQELADQMKKEVDLVDLSTASTVMQAQIITTGIPLYCSETTRRAEFTMKVLKMYAKLNEERQEILQKIKDRGTNHE